MWSKGSSTKPSRLYYSWGSHRLYAFQRSRLISSESLFVYIFTMVCFSFFLFCIVILAYEYVHVKRAPVKEKQC